ncbi:MAG: hypothetical protein RMX65_002365 [Nostoc sp. DedQUE01]|uniref:hypothetical protein n=1 Tax=Nostoc sp. CCY 9925 TaxID=3103865 RepID=UPI0039409D3A
MKVSWRQDLTIALCPKLCFNCYIDQIKSQKIAAISFWNQSQFALLEYTKKWCLWKQ